MVTSPRWGRTKAGLALNFLMKLKDVVPAAAVKADGVLTELVEDLVHFEGGGDGFDQHGGADGAALDACGVFGEVEDVVPEPRFQMSFRAWEDKSTAQLPRLMRVR